MAQENRYPSPEPGNQAHPYHNQQPQQPLPPENAPPIPHAPTAMMHETAGDANNVPQGFQYVQSYNPNEPSTPQQMAQQGLDADRGQSTDPSAKKKSKVSRACDECRRKKVRCDAETDQPGVQCTNCRRANAICQFSRQPQKRGPSKGYIKELAERVSRLEYPGAPQPEISYQGMPSHDAPTYSPHMPYNTPIQARKRTHSMADGAPEYLHGADQLQYHARGAPPPPAPSMAVMQAPVYDLPPQNGTAIVGIAQAVLDAYFRSIHILLPILPESQASLQSALDQAAPELRQAFFAAVHVAVRSASHTVPSPEAKAAADQCFAAQRSQSAASSQGDNLLRLQMLLFLTIADELGGPTSARGGTWLGSAVALANSLRLQRPVGANTNETGRLLRRSWLSLIILDRWHSAATCSATLVHDEDIMMDSSDHALLGSPSYHMLRISIALGHLSNAFLHHEQDLIERNGPGRAIMLLMRGEVQRIYESIEPLLLQMPLVHLAYLHVKILSDKATESSYASGSPIIEAARHSVHLLRSGDYSTSPFDHHFISLTAVALATALSNDQPAATEGLNGLLATCTPGRVPPGWQRSIGDYIHAKLSAHGAKAGPEADEDALRHLADAATGTGKQSQGRADWATVTSKGYLTVFA